MKKIKVLFLGRLDCIFSKKAINHLKKHDYEVLEYHSSSRGKLDENNFKNEEWDYIFSFRNLKIVPLPILNKSKIANINFHPGPPEYPGSGCINFALFEEAKYFGITIHHMEKKVDNGKIIFCKRFPLLKNDNVETLMKKTHKLLFEEFVNLTTQKDLKQNIKSLEDSDKNKWALNQRKINELDFYSTIKLDYDENKLKKLIRSFHTPNYPLKIILNGNKFILKN